MTGKLIAETELEAAALKEARFTVEHTSLVTVQTMQLTSQITHAVVTAVVQVLFRAADKAKNIDELLAVMTPSRVTEEESGGKTP